MDPSMEPWPHEIGFYWLTAIATAGYKLQTSWGIPDLIGMFSPETIPVLQFLEAFSYLFVIATYGLVFPLAHMLFPSKQKQKDLWNDRRGLWGFLTIFWLTFCLVR